MFELLAQAEPVANNSWDWQAISTMVIAICVLGGQIVSYFRDKNMQAKVEEVKHIANSLSDKRSEAAKDAGITQGKLQERDRAELAQQNQAIGAAGVPLASSPPSGLPGLPVGGTVVVNQPPLQVEVVNAPSDPVPTTAIKKV